MSMNVRRSFCFNTDIVRKSDAHIIQFDRANYNAPNLVKILKMKK